MLASTFRHLEGIGAIGERRLWDSGCLSWDALEADMRAARDGARRSKALRGIEASREALDRGDAAFFLRGLRGAAAARVYPDFRSRIGYVDIETTGLSAWAEITTIALYGAGALRLYVRGRNLEAFVDDVRRFDVLATYNGARFDLPFLRRAFGDVLPAGHIDLCPLLRGLGYRGGLKRCERLLGIQRQVPGDLDGYWAVEAWYRHVHGDPDALTLLLRYNAQDVLSLEQLLNIAWSRSMDGHPKPCEQPLAVQPDLSRIDADTLFFDNQLPPTYCRRPSA